MRLKNALLHAIKSSCMIGFVSFCALGCSYQRSLSAAEHRPQRKVRVVFSREFLQGEWFGLTDTSPAFIGLSAKHSDGNVLKQVNLSNAVTTMIELNVGSTVDFAASIVSYRDNDPFLYVSRAAEKLEISALTQEVVLTFSPYAAVKPINLYGLVYADKATPASGAKITILDPVSGAPVTIPGSGYLAVSDANGSFATSYPIDAYPSLTALEVLVEHKGVETKMKLPFARGSAVGVTLPYINLSEKNQNVSPQFANGADFDNDGKPNSLELAEGTNPFSELSGAKGSPGVATLASSTFSATLCSGAGGVTLKYYLDTDSSLTVNAGDPQVGDAQIICNGAPGAAGAAGEPGAAGIDGNDGAPGTPGTPGTDGNDGANLKLYTLSGGILPYLVRAIDVSFTNVFLKVNDGAASETYVTAELSSSSSYPLGINATQQCAHILSGAGPWNDCSNSTMVYPLSESACFYDNASCNGPCGLSKRPRPNHLFPVAASGGSYIVLKSPATPAPTIWSLSGGQTIYFSKFHTNNGCQSYPLSGGGMTINRYMLDSYTLSGGVSFPIGEVEVR